MAIENKETIIPDRIIRTIGNFPWQIIAETNGHEVHVDVLDTVKQVVAWEEEPGRQAYNILGRGFGQRQDEDN